MYIFDKIRERAVEQQEVIFHISDTPQCIYKFLFKAIERVKPDYIIHTGDMVDDVKLGSGASKANYEAGLKKIISQLEEYHWAHKYIVPGNHDSVGILKNLVNTICIKDEGSIISIDGNPIGLAHYKENLPVEAKINLFGHDKTTIRNKDVVFLNGLLKINIILLPSGEINKVSYPSRVEGGRRYKRLKLP